MKLLKLFFLLSIFFYCNACFAKICVLSSTNYKMFGSVIRAQDFTNGIKLAFQDAKFHDDRFFQANNYIQLASQVNKMTSGSCSLVLGLYTSRDCLIAGPILKKHKIIGVSPSCGDDSENQYLHYIYTATPPLSTPIYKIAKYLNNDKHTGKVVVIYQLTDFYSLTAMKQLKSRLSKPFIKIPVTFSGSFDIKKLSFAKSNPATLVFLTYPLPSVNIITTLFRHHLINNNVAIIGSPSWAFDVSAFKNIRKMLRKAKSVMVTSMVDWSKIEESEFSKNYIRRFHRKPFVLDVVTYDVTRLAIKCYRIALVKKEFKPNLFRHCMTQKTYHGISGSYIFSKSSVFAKKNLYMVSLFSLLDEIQ
jgi:hypothetical protein